MSKPFQARYSGRCPACDRGIREGDWIVYPDDPEADEPVHDTCHREGREYVDVLRERPVCVSCNVTKPCFCEDDV